jgi:hypothetical protein
MPHKSKVKAPKEKMVQIPIRVKESLYEKLITALCIKQNLLKRQVSMQEFITDLIEKELKSTTKES